MITSLRLFGFRGFDEFSLSELRPINLLVGRNNCGKTSILEAVHLLESRGNPSVMRSAMYRRGEIYCEEGEGSRLRTYLDICQLFAQRKISEGAKFRLESQGTSRDRWLSVRISGPGEYESDESFPESLRERLDGANALVFEGRPAPATTALPLTQRDGLSDDHLNRLSMKAISHEDLPPVFFVTNETQSANFLARIWEGVALTEEEDLLLEALRLLEPRVERIAVIGERPHARSSKSGVIVRMKGEKTPVPLGSMGDGMWRMLTMILATVKSANGVLLIDEIDTGLYHTAMLDMWHLMIRTALRLNVQVFATTHSLDCVKSLANVISEEGFSDDPISIQRVEKHLKSAVAYSQKEIVVAANRGTEMR